MKHLLSAALVLLLSSQLIAAPLMGKSTGYEWRKASRQERGALVEDALRRLKASYPASEMMACLNEVFSDPIKPHIHGRELAEVMTFCHIQIKGAY